MNELKPCPFCGSEAEIRRKQFAENTEEIIWVECKNCGAMSRFFAFVVNRIPPRAKTSDECFMGVRGAWNKRTEAEPIRRGHWVNYQGNPIIVDNQGYVRGEQAFCSACGEYLNGSDEYSVKGRYCPSCGAKMEDEE